MPPMIRALSPELRRIAHLELNETPKILEDSIQHLKEWIKKQPHLRACTDDQWLITFLRGCKYRLEIAKEKIDSYYTLKTTAHDMIAFTPQDPRFTVLFKTGAMLVLPKLPRPNYPRVVLIRPGLFDPNVFKLSDFISLCLTINRIMYLVDDALVVNGAVALVDLSGVTVTHILQATPVLLKKLVVAIQEASPMRLKEVHYINFLPIFEKIFKGFLKMVKEKHRKKLFVYSKGMSAVYEHIPKDILPAECGGNGGTVSEILDYWLKTIDEYGHWLKEDEKYGTDESKRPGKPITAESLFGIDGSFRQLEFD